MPPHGPFERSPDTCGIRTIRHCFTLTSEVPLASGCRNHELLNADEEGNEPAESEDEEPHHLSHFVFAVSFGVALFPFHIGHERVHFEFGCTNTEKVNCCDQPVSNEWHADNVACHWEKHDSKVGAHKL